MAPKPFTSAAIAFSGADFRSRASRDHRSPPAARQPAVSMRLVVDDNNNHRHGTSVANGCKRSKRNCKVCFDVPLPEIRVRVQIWSDVPWEKKRLNRQTKVTHPYSNYRMVPTAQVDLNH